VGQIKSLRADVETEILFRNDTDAARSVNWIDYSGKVVQYSVVPPGQELKQPTFLTHPWMIADERGTCLGVVEPVNKPDVVALSQFKVKMKRSSGGSSRLYDCGEIGQVEARFSSRGPREVVMLFGKNGEQATLERNVADGVPFRFLEPGQFSEFAFTIEGTEATIEIPDIGKHDCKVVE